MIQGGGHKPDHKQTTKNNTRRRPADRWRAELGPGGGSGALSVASSGKCAYVAPRWSQRASSGNVAARTQEARSKRLQPNHLPPSPPPHNKCVYTIDWNFFHRPMNSLGSVSLQWRRRVLLAVTCVKQLPLANGYGHDLRPPIPWMSRRLSRPSHAVFQVKVRHG